MSATTTTTTKTTTADDDTNIDFNNLEWRHDENKSKDKRAIQMAYECRQRLIDATQNIIKNTNPKTRGIILSGGVDTCAILEAAALAEASAGSATADESGGEDDSYIFQVAITVVIGDTSPDELYSKYAAWKHSKLIKKHVIIKMTPEQLIEEYLPKTIKLLQIWDGMTIRNSLVISAAFQKANELGLTDVLVGDGADELFGGYSFMWGKVDDSPLEWKEKRDSMCRQWTFATDDLAQSYNLVAHAPYENQELMVNWALSETTRGDCIADNRCYIQLKLGETYQKHTTGKVILREAFDTGSSWRRKDPIEVGSGATIIGYDTYWTNIIDEKYQISDEEFYKEQTKFKDEYGVIIKSKEYLVNIRTYIKIFGGIVHPTKKRYPINSNKGCIGCCFEINDSMFCHMCGAYPAQRTIVEEEKRQSLVAD